MLSTGNLWVCHCNVVAWTSFERVNYHFGTFCKIAEAASPLYLAFRAHRFGSPMCDNCHVLLFWTESLYWKTRHLSFSRNEEVAWFSHGTSRRWYFATIFVMILSEWESWLLLYHPRHKMRNQAQFRSQAMINISWGIHKVKPAEVNAPSPHYNSCMIYESDSCRLTHLLNGTERQQSTGLIHTVRVGWWGIW